MVGRAPEASRPRRLVVCLDGTQNSPEQEVKPVGGHKLYKPTNVLKTFRAIRPVDDEGVSQIAYYSEGVGSMIGEDTLYAKVEVWVDRIFGGVAAVGYGSRVKSAYRFLVANYRPGDQILVFGFSRGAAEAQTLVRFIAWVGGILHKDAAGGLLYKRNEIRSVRWDCDCSMAGKLPRWTIKTSSLFCPQVVRLDAT